MLDIETCSGVAQSTVSTWSMLDSTGNLETEIKDFIVADSKVSDDDSVVDDDFVEQDDDRLKKATPTNTLRDSDLSDAQKRARIQNYATMALEDNSWNSVTVHSVNDIVVIRIPQLQTRCAEEWNVLRCHGTDVTDTAVASFFTNLQVAYPKVQTWCGVTEINSSDSSCSSISDTIAGDNVEEELAKLRLEATLAGIAGWGRALRLNEDLKEGAEKVPASQVRNGCAYYSFVLPTWEMLIAIQLLLFLTN